MIIAGGAKQGLKEGDTFAVCEKGKRLKNQPTGMYVEFPGKQIGTVKVLSTGTGASASAEYSFVQLVQGYVDQNAIENYEIREVKQ